MQDKLFSIICPLYKTNYETLDRFILCLKEQDYRNWELILSYNSPDDKAHRFIHSKKSPLKGIKYKEVDAGYIPELKNGNHCRAFNEGFKISKGDYILCLDPDIYLYPGILREYKDAFDTHDVGFVYGDYDLENVGRIEGREYSEYELKCANYISGAYPVKREAWADWDENLLSLQDWDFRLSIVDKGYSGFYIDRPCFTTDAPKEGGVSHDSATNWLERYNKVREKHHNPASKTVVTSLGAPLHATKVAKVLGVDSRVKNNLFTLKPHEYENLYLIGFYPSAWQGHIRVFYDNGDVNKELKGKKRIIHWVGTDIYQMFHKLSYVAMKNIVNFLNDKDFEFIHLSEADFTQKELEEIGIKTQVIPIPTEKVFDLVPLPEKFTVGVYINPTQDMYFQSFMEEVASAMPDIDFKFFGNKNRVETIDNKEYVGFVEMEKFLPTISAMVRLTVHDGLPISPIEAMQMGRNVLASAPLKYALHAEYKDGQPIMEKIIEQIREMETMPLNEEGSAYWRVAASPETFCQRMRGILEDSQ